MQREYVEVRGGGYYVAGTRVSLASIVYDYRDGAAPETIRQNFPTLSLEQIHGAIAFYLGHQEQVEAYLLIAGTLRGAAGVDFRRAEAVPFEGLDDPVVLARAAEDGRTLVSHDVNTIERDFRDVTRDQKSPGLILIPQKKASIGPAIESLVFALGGLDASDLQNRICLVPNLLIY